MISTDHWFSMGIFTKVKKTLVVTISPGTKLITTIMFLQFRFNNTTIHNIVCCNYKVN